MKAEPYFVTARDQGAYGSLQISLPSSRGSQKLHVKYRDWYHTMDDELQEEIFNWRVYFDDTSREETPLEKGMKVVLVLRLYNSSIAAKALTFPAACLPTPSAEYMYSQRVDLVGPLRSWSAGEDEQVGEGEETEKCEKEEQDSISKDLKETKAETIKIESIPRNDSHSKDEARALEEAYNKRSSESQQFHPYIASKPIPPPLLWVLQGDSDTSNGSQDSDRKRDDVSALLLPTGGCSILRSEVIHIASDDNNIIEALRNATEKVKNVSVNLVSVQIKKCFVSVSNTPSSPSKSEVKDLHEATSKSKSMPFSASLRDKEPDWEQMDWKLDPSNPTELSARVLGIMHNNVVYQTSSMFTPSIEPTVKFEQLQEENEIIQGLDPVADICQRCEEFVSSGGEISSTSTETSTLASASHASTTEQTTNFSGSTLASKTGQPRKVKMVWRRTLLFTRLALLIFKCDEEQIKLRDTVSDEERNSVLRNLSRSGHHSPPSEPLSSLHEPILSYSAPVLHQKSSYSPTYAPPLAKTSSKVDSSFAHDKFRMPPDFIGSPRGAGHFAISDQELSFKWCNLAQWESEKKQMKSGPLRMRQREKDLASTYSEDYGVGGSHDQSSYSPPYRRKSGEFSISMMSGRGGRGAQDPPKRKSEESSSSGDSSPSARAVPPAPPSNSPAFSSETSTPSSTVPTGDAPQPWRIHPIIRHAPSSSNRPAVPSVVVTEADYGSPSSNNESPPLEHQESKKGTSEEEKKTTTSLASTSSSGAEGKHHQTTQSPEKEGIDPTLSKKELKKLEKEAKKKEKRERKLHKK